MLNWKFWLNTPLSQIIDVKVIYETDQSAGFEKETTKTNYMILSRSTTQNIRGLRQERMSGNFSMSYAVRSLPQRGVYPFTANQVKGTFTGPLGNLVSVLCSRGDVVELASNIQRQ